VARAPELIAEAIRNFERQVPALAKLKLVFRLELRGRGDVQVYRVQVPGPEITHTEPEDARVGVSIPRPLFNELAVKGKLADWREAYERGNIRASGDPEIRRLIATVIQRQEARSQLRKARSA
jgi:hypothetical protein